MITISFLDFFKRILLFSMILGIVVGGLYFILPENYITPALPLLFAFFIGASLTGYYYLIRSVGKKFIKFLNSYLLYTVVKLFLFITIMVVYILINRQDAVAFGITFLVLYFCYTIFEVIALVSYSKRGTEN